MRVLLSVYLVSGIFGGLIPSRVKSMTYTFDHCRMLIWRSALIGYCKGGITQVQDIVTEWDIGSWFWWPDFKVGQYYKVVH